MFIVMLLLGAVVVVRTSTPTDHDRFADLALKSEGNSTDNST
jgi:hypothetical protein